MPAHGRLHLRGEVRTLKRAIGALMLAAFAGCATTAVPSSEAGAPSEVLSVAMTSPRQGAEPVFVKRDRGTVGSACAIRATVDGQGLALLRAGQGVMAHLSPGEHVFGASSTGICGGGDAEAAITVRAGQPSLAVRISIDQGASIRIGPTAQ